MRRHPWLTAAIVLVALGAGLYFCFEWLVERRWQQDAAEARARGVKMLLTDFARPKIPDSQNFAALPMMRAGLTSGGNPFALPARPKLWALAVPAALVPPPVGDAVRGVKIDWAEWRSYFQEVRFLTETSDNPARDALRALDHYAPFYQEWSEWRTRPQCQFPLDLTKGIGLPLPHLSTFQGAAKVFSLRMRAHLALGDSEAASADFQDAFQGWRALKDEPTLISGLVRISLLSLLLNPVGDGLRDHQWTDESLRKIDSALATVQLWEDYRLALSSERGSANTTYESVLKESMKKRAQMLYGSNATPAPTSLLLLEFLPKSVWRANQLRQNRYFDELLARIAPANAGIELDRETPSSPERITDQFEQRYYFIFRLSASNDWMIEQRYFALQTLLDEARLACALERFRFARGKYPEALTELAPDFIAALPSDPYARAPYRYQRMGEASFRLYSVGENRQDDSGQIDPRQTERKQRDAIWLYAPPAAH